MVGPNASGKSTFLDTLGFVKDALQEGVEKAVRSRARTLKELTWMQQKGGFELAVELLIPDSLRKVLPQRLPYRMARYELAVDADPSNGITVKAENLWLIVEGKERNNVFRRQLALFPIEWDDEPFVTQRGQQGPAGWRRVVAKREGGDYFRSEITDWNIMFKLSPVRPALSSVPEDERFALTLWVRNMLLTGVQALQLNSMAMRESCPPDMPEAFQLDGSNLPLVIRRLGRNAPRRYEWWVSHVQTALPDVEEIQIKQRPENRYFYLVVKHQTGLRVPSWLLSDGTLRLLALTLIAFLEPKAVIYLIEEPENGIHPKAIETVFRALAGVQEGQVFLATHSPVILGLAEPSQLLCFARTSSGATDIVRGDQHPALQNWQNEVSLDVLFAAGVLG